MYMGQYKHPNLMVGDLVHFCMDTSLGIIFRIVSDTPQIHKNNLLYHVLWSDGNTTPHHDYLLRKVT